MHFGDGSSLRFSTDKSVLKEELEKVEKGSFEKSQELIKTGYRLFELSMDHLLGRNFYRLWDFVTPEQCPASAAFEDLHEAYDAGEDVILKTKICRKLSHFRIFMLDRIHTRHLRFSPCFRRRN